MERCNISIALQVPNSLVCTWIVKIHVLFLWSALNTHGEMAPINSSSHSTKNHCHSGIPVKIICHYLSDFIHLTTGSILKQNLQKYNTVLLLTNSP